MTKTTKSHAATAAAQQSLYEQFDECHREPLNLVLHLLTTSTGLIGALALMSRPAAAIFSIVMVVFGFYYNFHMGVTISRLTTVVAPVYCAILYAIAGRFTGSSMAAIVVVGLSYVLQGLAHTICGEPTLENRYYGHTAVRFAFDMIVHTLLLPFMLFESTFARAEAIGRMFAAPLRAASTITVAKVDVVAQGARMQRICDWIDSHIDPKLTTTSHWWFSDEVAADITEDLRALALDPAILQSFHEVFPERYYAVEPVWQMNEIYVSTLDRSKMNSDYVFYTHHIDGPWGLFYGCYLHRAMLGLNENTELQTNFPMKPFSVVISKGDCVGFDFNREIHVIDKTEHRNTAMRKNLKLHYVATPKIFFFLGPVLGFLTSFYDRRARDFFLFTLDCKTMRQRLSIEFIMFSTHATRWFEQLIGYHNLIYWTFCAVVAFVVYPAVAVSPLCQQALATVSEMVSFDVGVSLPAAVAESPLVPQLGFVWSSWTVWYLMTSFCHYIIYIATWQFRDRISYYLFLRNAILHKSMMYVNMASIVLSSPLLSSASAPLSLPDGMMAGTAFVNATSQAVATAASSSLLWQSVVLIIGGYFLSVSATAALGTVGTYFGAELGQCEWKIVRTFPYSVTSHPMIIGQITAIVGWYLLFSHYSFPSHSREDILPLWWALTHIVLYSSHALQEHFSFGQGVPGAAVSNVDSADDEREAEEEKEQEQGQSSKTSGRDSRAAARQRI